MDRNGAAIWIIRAPLPRIPGGWTRGRFLRHRTAMMFAGARATGRELRFGACENRRADQREAEDSQQQDCPRAPHSVFILHQWSVPVISFIGFGTAC
jgi:hypothetical protein